MIEPNEQKKIELFYDYLVTDEIGDWVGISEEAPSDAKAAYDSFMKEKRAAEKAGVKI